MAAAQHKLSRRGVLAGACTGAGVTGWCPLVRHSGLDPEPMNTAATPAGTSVFPGPGLRRDDAGWQKALARFRRAESGLGAVAHSEDDDLYDRALGRHNRALAGLLRAPAPDLAAAADKLDLILRHSVFELNFGEASLAALRRDLRRFAGQVGTVTSDCPCRLL